MKHAAVFTVAMFFLALFGTPQITKAANTTNSQNNSTVEQIWEVAGFSMPESVAISPTDNWIYVSNVNGDKNGYISRLTKDGKIDNLQWVTGLDNPADLARIFHDFLI
ncbi:MAG: DNA-binding beta-propeller fold protein YncE [Desulforhopalus sp.]|jgi:DNA-binding beta-propeller fold protein YncE